MHGAIGMYYEDKICQRAVTVLPSACTDLRKRDQNSGTVRTPAIIIIDTFELKNVLVLHHMMTSAMMYDIEADRSNGSTSLHVIKTSARGVFSEYARGSIVNV